MTEKIKLNDLDKDEAALVRKLQPEEMNRQCNNRRLRESLKWEAEKYWNVRNRLLSRGILGKAHGGPGGKTVLMAEIDSGSSRATGGKPRKAVPGQNKWTSEKSLYKPMADQIDVNWAKEQDYHQHMVRVRANLGSKKTGGKWSRPDICLVGVQKFKFVKEPVFDVVSFEVKPSKDISVQGVFEALSHRQSTNRAYVIYQCAQKDFTEIDEAGRITALGEKHGVGVILAEDPEDQFSWHEAVRGERWDPDPANLNEFIEQVFNRKDHDEILKML